MEYTEKEIEKIIKDCDWEMENFQRLSSKESDNLMKVVKQLVKSLLFGVSSKLNVTFKRGNEVVYDGEKFKIVFIDLKTGFLKLEACYDGCILVDINPKHCTKSI